MLDQFWGRLLTAGLLAVMLAACAGSAAAGIDYRVLDDAAAAQVLGGWGYGWYCMGLPGCGSGCLPYDDPNDVYHSKQAKDIHYHACGTGYPWQTCTGGQTVSCARWVFFSSASCSGKWANRNCIWESDACEGNPDCPAWPW